MILEDPRALTYRKQARIVAVRMSVPFIVHTDRGPMRGNPGDYLVTNHPDDDPGSDLWTISAARMASTYAVDPSGGVRPSPTTTGPSSSPGRGAE